MSDVHVVLVLNPAARAGAHRGAADLAAARLRQRGVSVTAVSGGSAVESRELVRAAVAEGADAVVVAGGDGTARLALEELAGSTVPLGLVPIGTGNDLAAALGLPTLDAEAAADAVADGATRRIDLARVIRSDGSASVFATVLASGFDSLVNDRANAMRWPRGGSRYTIAVLREFVTLRGFDYRVEIEDATGTRRVIDGELVMATVGNTGTYGGGIPICPFADPADGLLDVTLVRPAGRARLLRLLPRVYRGTHTTVPEAITARARSVRLEAAGITAYADGDPIGMLPLTVEVLPQAVSVFAPAVSASPAPRGAARAPGRADAPAPSRGTRARRPR